MKRRILLSFFLGSTALSLLAQKSYFSIKTGLATGIFQGYAQEADIHYTGTGYSGTVRNIDFSLGKGVKAGLAFGHFFTKNIGVEVGIDYMSCQSKGINSSNIRPIDYYPDLQTSMTKTYKAQTFCFNPSFILSTDRTRKASIYCKTGLLVANIKMTNEVKATQNVINYTSSNKIDMEEKYTGHVSYGFSASTGLTYKLFKSLSAFGEIELISLQYTPNESTITKYDVDGLGRISDLSPYQVHTIYTSDSYKVSSETPDPTLPTTVAKEKYPFNSIGVNVGLRINLW